MMLGRADEVIEIGFRLLQCMSPVLARFDRSLRRRRTSGIEGEAEVDVAWTKRREYRGA